jgi:hypothetical protein
LATTDAAGPVCHAATAGPGETPKIFRNDVFPLTATFGFAADKVEGSPGKCSEDNLHGRCGSEPGELGPEREGAAATWIFVSAGMFSPPLAPNEVVFRLLKAGRIAGRGDEMVG